MANLRRNLGFIMGLWDTVHHFSIVPYEIEPLWIYLRRFF